MSAAAGNPALERALEAAQALQPRLNAFITVTSQQARAAAPPHGALHGVPIAIKDLIATRGIRTTAGSRILGDWVPARDAAIVRALAGAGAVSIGKTGTHEFAFGTTNDNPHYGPTRNPWNPALTTGGSSGGSAAAVAAGIVPLALGTDTAGSVRIPAALCGCVGFKPGWGVLSTRGVVPLAPTFDTVGFLAATVDDAAAGFAAATGGDAKLESVSLAGITVGVPESYVFDRAEDDVVRAVEEAILLLERRGARIRRIGIGELARCLEVGVPIVRAEALRYHARWFPARREEYGADVAKSLDAAREITAQEYLGALQSRARISRAIRGALQTVDLLAGPTVPLLAFENRVAYEPVGPGGELPRFALTRLTYPFNISRLPAISMPCGLAGSGLPVGLQLAAATRRERFLLAAAKAYEAARGPWPKPPVSA
jgi:aspartyl-tRNA(Asn)/glutamyl-tRNA(Gln) amidotransferase subunit A